MFFKKEYNTKGLEDDLNYLLPLCDEPTVLGLKDGAFLRGWDLQGPDLRYASPAERERLSRIVEHAFRLIADNGWCIHVIEGCLDQRNYFPARECPDPTTALIDEEARKRYTAQGAHYEHSMALCITWKPQHEWTEKYSRYFYEGMERGKEGRQGVLREFIRKTDELVGVLETVIGLPPMNRSELFTCLATCATGLAYERHAPRPGIPWDHAVMNQEVRGGEEPMIGQLHQRTVAIDGFPPYTEPQMMEFLAELGIPYIKCDRYVFMDQLTAAVILDRKRKKMAQQRKGPRNVAGGILTGDAGHKTNIAKAILADDAQVAKSEVDLGEAVYGVVTQTLSLFHTDKEEIDRRVSLLQQGIRFHGWGARLETVNAMDAYVGALPGHSAENLRSVPFPTYNLADVLPVTTIWAGQPTVTSPFFPKNSPALLMGTTIGQSAFCVSPFYGDVGHFWMTGPSGSGKTTGLNIKVASWLARYQGSKARAFDAKYGMYALCRATGGKHYDVGGADRVGMMPYARVEDERERVWAHGFTLECLRLQGRTVTDVQSNEIWEALGRLGAKPGFRSMTDFYHTVQDKEVRNGLRYYCSGGGGGDLFECEETTSLNNNFIVYELSHIFSRGDADLIPAMLYFTHEVERGLDGSPTLITFDEVWMALLRSQLGHQVEKWLRQLRDKNAILGFASQSLAEIERSPEYALLVGLCPTKIFAPDPEAETEEMKRLYTAVGLNEQEIAAIKNGRPKSEYFYHSPMGRGSYTMDLGRGALSVVGVSGVQNVPLVKECFDRYGEMGTYHWLLQRGCTEEAAWWLQKHKELQGEEKKYVSLFSAPHGWSSIDADSPTLQ